MIWNRLLTEPYRNPSLLYLVHDKAEVEGEMTNTPSVPGTFTLILWLFYYFTHTHTHTHRLCLVLFRSHIHILWLFL